MSHQSITITNNNTVDERGAEAAGRDQGGRWHSRHHVRRRHGGRHALERHLSCRCHQEQAPGKVDAITNDTPKPNPFLSLLSPLAYRMHFCFLSLSPRSLECPRFHDPYLLVRLSTCVILGHECFLGVRLERPHDPDWIEHCAERGRSGPLQRPPAHPYQDIPRHGRALHRLRDLKGTHAQIRLTSETDWRCDFSHH